jgi:phage gpG-like protein
VTSVFSLLEAAAHFKHLADDFPKACHAGLEAAARIVEARAKSAIGSYIYGWPQLAQSTQAERVKKGFSENQPLLRTGELRDSIQHSSSPTEARVGSNLDRAVWMELGTSKTPPRPFLAPSLYQSEAAIKRAVRQVVANYMRQSRADFDILKAAFEALREVAHELKEVGERFVSPEDDDNRRRR